MINQSSLVKRLKEADPQAFGELVEEYQDQVINTCYRFLFNREDARDVAQEVFIVVYNSVSTFKETASISTWLYRIAVNRSIDFIRSKKRKKRFAPVMSLLGMQEQGWEPSAPVQEMPDEQMEQEERLNVLHGAIDKLPENQRIAFTLSKCDYLGNKEIARIMGVSLSSVDSLIHRAKKNLRKQLFKYFEKDLRKNPKLLLFLSIIFFLFFQRKICLLVASKLLK